MESELLNVGATNLTVPYREIDRLAEVSLTFRTSMALIYFLTAIVAFVANLFAILLLVYGPRRSRQLNQFLANLGASDILFAICNIPFTYITLVYNTWWLPEFLCPLSSFVQVLAPTVAFYTLIAIGIGRYFVIVTGHELLFLTKSRHTKIAICLIWIFAILLAAPILFVSKISPVVFENVHYVECSEDWSTLEALWPLRESANPSTILDTVVGVTPHTSGSRDGIENFAEFILTTSTTSLPPTVETFVSSTPTILSTESVGQEPQRIGQLYTIVVFVLTFILPVVTLTYLYGHIGLIVYKHQLPFGNDSHITNQNLTQTKIKVVKMLLILVISFIICWSPAQIFYLMLWVFEDIRQDTELASSSPTLASATGSAMPVMDVTGAAPSSFLSSTVSSNVFLSAPADTTPPPPPPLGSTSGSSWYSVLYYTMYFSFHWLSCAHTIINPFVYCFFSNNFQKNDLIAILLCRGSSHDRNKRRSVNLGHSSAAFARNNSLNNNNNNSQNHPNPNNAQKQRPNSNRARSTVNATVQKQPSFGTGGTGNGHVVQRYNTGNGAHRIKHQQQVNAGGGGVVGVGVNVGGAGGGVVSGLRLANDCVVTIRDHSLTDQPYNDV